MQSLLSFYVVPIILIDIFDNFYTYFIITFRNFFCQDPAENSAERYCKNKNQVVYLLKSELLLRRRGIVMEKQIDNLLHGAQFKQLMEKRIMEIREKYGLRKVDVEVMYYLSRCGDRDTSKDIKCDTRITKGHISQSIDRLQKMGLLAFVPDENDRRCIHLKLTDQAGAVVFDIEEVWNDLNQIVFEGVTEEEKKVLASVACKIARNIDRVLEEQRR